MIKYRNLLCYQSILFIFGLLGLVISLVGCYEGRNRPPQRDVPGGGGPNKPTDSRIYYFILFEPIVLADESIGDLNCFSGPMSERNYRRIEWTTRIKALTQGLELLTEKLVVMPTPIHSADCGKFFSIRQRATVGTDNKDQWPTERDRKNRISVHLKAVFWDRDSYSWSTGSEIQKVDWADVRYLRNHSINTISLYYRVHSNRAWGFIENWFWNLPFQSVLSISGIGNPDPADGGIEKRSEQIRSDTQEFFLWFEGAAHDLAPRD